MNTPRQATPLDAPVPLSQVAYDARVNVQDVMRLAQELGWQGASAESVAPPIYASLLRRVLGDPRAMRPAGQLAVTPRGAYERIVLGND